MLCRGPQLELRVVSLKLVLSNDTGFKTTHPGMQLTTILNAVEKHKSFAGWYNGELSIKISPTSHQSALTRFSNEDATSI